MYKVSIKRSINFQFVAIKLYQTCQQVHFNLGWKTQYIWSPLPIQQKTMQKLKTVFIKIMHNWPTSQAQSWLTKSTSAQRTLFPLVLMTVFYPPSFNTFPFFLAVQLSVIAISFAILKMNCEKNVDEKVRQKRIPSFDLVNFS